MSTSTLLNYLEENVSAETSNRSKTETLIANGTIAEGQAVALDLTKTGTNRALYCVAADTGSPNTILCVGIATHSAIAGEKVNVVVGGYYAKANVHASTVAGDMLLISGVAGQLLKRATQVVESGSATVLLYPVVAMALEDDSAVTNVAAVFVMNNAFM